MALEIARNARGVLGGWMEKIKFEAEAECAEFRSVFWGGDHAKSDRFLG